MGCQVSCGDFDINYSCGSWLVERMTCLWFDEKRDTDGEGYQWSISAHALRSADKVVPMTNDEFKKWAESKNIRIHFKFGDDDFKIARAFIENAAITNESASFSY